MSLLTIIHFCNKQKTFSKYKYCVKYSHFLTIFLIYLKYNGSFPFLTTLHPYCIQIHFLPVTTLTFQG